MAATILATAPHAQSFQGLGDLPGGPPESLAFGLSDDGTTVVGRSGAANGLEAFRWTPADGMVGLGDLPGGAFSSEARHVSADGSVVVGSSQSAASAGDGAPEAFRWTAATGLVALGDFPGSFYWSEAYGVSADGDVVVGGGTSTASSAFFDAFRWTAAAGLESLGDLAGGIFNSFAYAVSADGSAVVGASSSANGSEAFRWTAGGGMTGLGDLPGGSFSSIAVGVSADGAVVVGQGRSASGFEAFRWTAADGMVGLGDLPGGTFSSGATDVSADGSVIVGSSRSATGTEAFLWRSGSGMRALRDVLVTDLGLDLTGWTLAAATAISADGTVVAGYGTNPAGQTEAWRAVLAPTTSDAPGGVPFGFALSVRPNPVRGAAAAALSVPAPGHVSVAVYDRLGRRVAVLHDGPMAAGVHALAWDARGLAGGVYVVRATNTQHAVSRRLTVLP